MKHSAFFRLLSMLTVLFYSTALAQTGQVITQGDKSWAKEALQQEKTMGAISTPNSIAVLYFNNKSGQDKLNPLQKGMAVMLITDLAKVEQLQVVERIRMQALLDEMDLGASGVVDAQTAPTVGKLLGAYFVASGDILAGTGQDLGITASVLDVPFETLTQQPTVTGALDQLFTLEKELLFNIVDQLQITLSPAKIAELQIPLSASSTALMALFLGIDHSDKGQYAQAAKMYEQALVEDPNLKMAKSALQELKGMGLTSAEEIVAVDEPLTAPAVEAGGSGMGTVLLVGLGLVAAGGAAFALSSSGSSSDDNDTPPDVTPPGDTTGPTVSSAPTADSEVQCASGKITYTFSEEMDTTAGQVVISPDDFAGGSWSDAQRYVIAWKTSRTFCDSSLNVSFSGLKDTAGNALSGATSFGYSVIP